MTTWRRALITGGTSGIGLGLARRLAARGAEVVVTGRDPRRLQQAVEGLPGSTGIRGDLADPVDRERLAAQVGPIDLLVDNAGAQRRVGLAEDTAPWPVRQAELDLVLAAPMHLAALLVPAMLQRGTPGTIVHVTSGGAFVPQPFAPGYSAAKAALHSFTLNLRHALASTPLRVVELIPPAVATGLSGLAHPHGADPDEFCDAAMAGLEAGEEEIGFGPTATPAFRRLLQEDRARFEAAAPRFPVPGYAGAAASRAS